MSNLQRFSLTDHRRQRIYVFVYILDYLEGGGGKMFFFAGKEKERKAYSFQPCSCIMQYNYFQQVQNFYNIILKFAFKWKRVIKQENVIS